MYVRERSNSGLGNLGFPWITTAIGVPIKHLECLSAPRGVLDSFLPAPLSIAERISMLEADAGGAAFLALRSGQALENPTEATVDAFRKAFGPVPNTVLRGMKESIGSIVRRRFNGALKLLESGALLYSCGLPARGGGPEQDGLDYQFKVRQSEYWIALGLHFWLEPFSDDRFAMLLMAALRVGYSPWVTETSLTNTANVFCYAKFAFLSEGAEPPPFIEEKCPKFV
jgi:hypothetical protein